MKTTITTIIQLSILCTLILTHTYANAQSFYKWVDSNGSTHYTKTPPPKHVKKQGQVETYGFNVSTSNHSASTAPTDGSSQQTTEQPKSEQNTVSTPPVESAPTPNKAQTTEKVSTD